MGARRASSAPLLAQPQIDFCTLHPPPSPLPLPSPSQSKTLAGVSPDLPLLCNLGTPTVMDTLLRSSEWEPSPGTPATVLSENPNKPLRELPALRLSPAAPALPCGRRCHSEIWRWPRSHRCTRGTASPLHQPPLPHPTPLLLSLTPTLQPVSMLPLSILEAQSGDEKSEAAVTEPGLLLPAWRCADEAGGGGLPGC